MEIKIYAPQVRDDALVSRYDLTDALAYALWDEDNHPFVPQQVRVVSDRNDENEVQSLAVVTGLDLNGPDKQARRRVYAPAQTWRAPDWLHRMVDDNEQALRERLPNPPQEG